MSSKNSKLEWRSKYNSYYLHLCLVDEYSETRLCDKTVGKKSSLKPERHTYGKKCKMCLEIESLGHDCKEKTKFAKQITVECKDVVRRNAAVLRSCEKVL